MFFRECSAPSPLSLVVVVGVSASLGLDSGLACQKAFDTSLQVLRKEWFKTKWQKKRGCLKVVVGFCFVLFGDEEVLAKRG